MRARGAGRLKDKQPLANERIRYEHLQVIADDGFNLGVISREEALRRAHEVGLDLVLLSDEGAEGAPVAKIMDFGKALYSKKKKQVAAKKKQKVVKVKEIKVRPKIGDHDFQTKIRQMIQFLKEGNRVKMTLVFRGREVATRNERGGQLFEKIDQTLAESGIENLATERDTTMGQFWSRVYYIK